VTTKHYGKRDPSSHRTPEQIHAMDHGYNHRPVIVKEREMPNEARTMMKRKVGAKAIEGSLRRSGVICVGTARGRLHVGCSYFWSSPHLEAFLSADAR
jgi:hypothetical protein